MANQDDKIWLKRESETAKAYEAFCAYRDLGPSRTLEKCRKEIGHTHGGWISSWSAKEDWVDRAAAYDGYKDRLRLEAQEQAIREAQHKLSTEALNVLEEALAGIKSGDISTPQQRAIADWLDRAGLKPVEEIRHSGKVEVDVDPQDKLKEIYGDS